MSQFTEGLSVASLHSRMQKEKKPEGQQEGLLQQTFFYNS